MRQVFIDQSITFFKNRLKVDITSKKHYSKLIAKLDSVNIKKTRIVGLLPEEELRFVLARPCSIRVSKTMDHMHLMNDPITSFKKLRAVSNLSEASICEVCSLRNICHLQGKEAEGRDGKKVASSKDVLLAMYFLAKEARNKERVRQWEETQEEAESEGDWEEGMKEQKGKKKKDLEKVEVQEIVEEESRRQMEEYRKGVSGKKDKEILPEKTLSEEESFAFYVSAIRLLDSLHLIVPDNEVQKDDILEMLESHVVGFSKKKRVDIALNLQPSIKRDVELASSSKGKRSRLRDDSKSRHELLALSSMSMEAFSKKLGPDDSQKNFSKTKQSKTSQNKHKNKKYQSVVEPKDEDQA